MAGNRVLYLDAVPQTFERLLREQTPAPLELLLWERMTPRQRDENLARADYLLVATRKVDRAVIDRAARVRLIQKTGVGADNIDVRAAAVRGIPVANTPGANAAAVAEHTILLILVLYRRLLQLDAATRRGEWPMWRFRDSSLEMRGKVHGLIGFGNIGREVARRSGSFGTRVLYFDKVRASTAVERETRASFAPLEEVIGNSDILSLHIPLLAETRHLVGAAELASMKANSVLINVARGGIVDEAALVSGLNRKHISGAALDVWEEEPVRSGNPLLHMENVVVTPHAAAGTRDTLRSVLRAAFGNIERVARGEEPLHTVDQGGRWK